MFKLHYPIEPILVTALMIVAAILQMLYFLKDDRTPNTENLNGRYSDVWHATGGIFRIAACWVIGRAYGWEFCYAALVATWIWFDGAINTWVLRKEWFYVGTTARTDRAIRWVGKKLRIDPRTVNAAVKGLVATYLLIYLISHAWK